MVGAPRADAQPGTAHFVNNVFDASPFDLAIRGTGLVSSNADLVALTVSSGTFTPVFDAATTSYALSLGFNVSSVTVTPATADVNATVQIRVNGGPYSPVASGSASAVLALNVGLNTIDVLVTAQDAGTKLYSITTTRLPIAPGDVDPNFSAYANESVHATATQPDGKIVIGGRFTAVKGVTHNFIARLMTDGALDGNFDPGVDGQVTSVAVQADGRVLLGGSFTTVGGNVRNFLARTNADGTLDTGFNPNPDGPVRGLAIQPDGTILLAGTFTTVGGVTRNKVARLNSNGTLDATFNASSVVDSDPAWPIHTLALQSDGKILLGGRGIKRLLPDGTLDRVFGPSPDVFIWSLAVQADGKILLGGDSSLSRLNRDGTPDVNFHADVFDVVYSAVAQADGKVVVVGDFPSVAGVARDHIARLNADGSVDSDFDPNAGTSTNPPIESVLLQADGRIVIGGSFTTVGGLRRSHIARLENESATQSLSVPSPSRVLWLRGGVSPETMQVAFELSTNGGSTYSPLGAGTRVNGGWELTGLSLPMSGQIRARARIAGGIYSGSSGLVETVGAFGLSTTSISDASVVEGNDQANLLFPVRLSGPSASPVTVNYATANGTALAPSDYTATSGTLAFNPGEVVKFVSVPIIGDAVFEQNEALTLNLSGATGATVLDGIGVGTILNDDGSTISVTDNAVLEGTSETPSSLAFVVALSEPSTQTITINYATVDGTALAGADYAARSGTLTFEPGAASQTVFVPVIQDAALEPDETIFLNLSNVVNATSMDDQGLGTILNDDRRRYYLWKQRRRVRPR